MSRTAAELAARCSVATLLATTALFVATATADNMCIHHALKVDVGAPTRANDLAARGDRLFVAGEEGLEVWDLRDPANPTRISRLPELEWSESAKEALHLEAPEGREIVLYSVSWGTMIADVSDPAGPVTVATLAAGSFSASGEILAHRQEYSATIEFLDISDPSRPVEVSTYASTGFYSTTGMLARGNILYVVVFGHELHVIDFSDPAAPKELSSLFMDFGGLCPPGLCNFNQPIAADDRLLVVGEPEHQGGMYLVDITDPEHPADIGSLGPFFDVVLSGPLAFGCGYDGKLSVVDVSAPASPVTLTELELGAVAWYEGRLAMVGTSLIMSGPDRGLTTIDVSVPALPRVLCEIPSYGYLHGIEEQDDLAVACLGMHGVVTLDVTDPLAPQELGRLVWDGLAYDAVLGANNRFASIAAWHRGLAVVGLDDPRHPQLLATHETEAFARWIAASGDWVVVGEPPFYDDDFHGFELFDLSEPSAPALLATVPTGPEIESVAIDGSLVAVADGELRLYDCSDPANVTEVASLPFGPHYGVAVSDRLALDSRYVGLALFDVSVPSAPLELWCTSGAWGRAIDFVERRAAVAGYNVYVVDATNLSAPELYEGDLYSIRIRDVALTDRNVLLARHPYLDIMTLECRPPEANMRLAQSGFVVELSDASLYGFLTRSWDLGDGTTSGSYGLIHRYQEPGTYQIVLTVTNSLGTSSATRVVAVPQTRPPTPRLPHGRVGP